MKFIPKASLLLATLTLSGAAFGQAAKPNIIFVLVDDMGWGDLGVFYQNGRNFSVNRNSPAFATPNIDTMATEGIQLRRHYCPAPVCAPSRASLLLGVHQGHANIRDNQFDKALEDNHTLGTVLRQAGYATAMIGKYGLQGSGLPAPARPELRGFDYFFGYLEHGDAHLHYPKESGANVYDDTTDVAADLDKCYSTDLIAARAKKWIIDQHAANAGQPFFLYLPFTAPHARLDVPTQAYPSGKGVSGGVQWLGTPGSMINTASGTINSWLHPDYENATYDNDDNPGTAEAAWPAYAKRHATMIRRLDDAVSDLIQTLKDLNLDDNTMVVFTSDNGPHNEAGSGGSYTYNPTFFDSFGPMDGIKRDTWEGGMREPCIVRWPGHIAAGGISTSASQFQDWMPTFAELAGIPVPARSDGVSLVPTLTGSGTQRESTIYVEYNYNGSTPNYVEFETSRRGAIRGEEQVIHADGYKGIRYNVTSATDDFLIYDTLNDPKETTDLAGSSAFFIGLQQRMKDRVLQTRRPGGGVSRPYDSALVPPVTVAGLIAGLEYRTFEDTFPWVPDFTTLASATEGDCSGVDLSVRTRDDDIGLLYTGYLDVPADGTYIIYLTSDSRAFLRLHDAGLIDADFGYTGGTEVSSSVNLKAGRHPIRLGYVRGGGGTPSLSLKWSGPGISKQTIPVANLLRVDPGIVLPPDAVDDSAVMLMNTQASINVLANDAVGSGPGPLELLSVGTPTHGVANAAPSNMILYTPASGFTGEDSFTYTVSDGLTNAVATVTVTVSAAIPPVANSDIASTTTGTPVPIPVLNNDTDDGMPAALEIVDAGHPSHGTATISGTSIVYTPSAGFAGEDTFDYTISDGQNLAVATVSISVFPVSDVVWLPLDEADGTVVRDAMGGDFGTLDFFPPSPWTSGHFGNALAFDGVDDRVMLNGYKGVTGTAARTVSFWLNADTSQTVGTRPTMVSWGAGNGSSAGTRFDINLNHTNGYKLRVEFNSSGVNFTTPARSDLRGSGWVHCALVMPAGATVSEVQGYIDGVQATPVLEPSGSGGTLINTTVANDVALGRIADSSSGRVMAGMLDDVRIYPRALNAGEIAALASQSPDGNLQARWFYSYTGNDSPVAADWLLDTDRDGIGNRLEFALGGNPTAFSSDIAPILVNGLDFVFNRRRDGIAPVCYVPEISETLDSWAPFGTASVAPHPVLVGFDRVTFSLPPSADPARFVRLRVDP